MGIKALIEDETELEQLRKELERLREATARLGDVSRRIVSATEAAKPKTHDDEP